MDSWGLVCRRHGAEQFPLDLPLELAARRRDIVATRPAHVDLQLMIEKNLLKALDRLIAGPMKFAAGMGIERN